MDSMGLESFVGQVLLLKTLVGKVLRPEDTSGGSRVFLEETHQGRQPEKDNTLW